MNPSCLAASSVNPFQLAAFIAVPLGIAAGLLWARDKGHLKTALGVLAVLAALGIAIALFNHYGPGKGRPWDGGGTAGAVVAGVLALLGARWIRHGGPGIEHVPPDFKCDELKESIEQARASMPWFLEQVEKNVDGAFVKFPLVTPNGITEHIWAYVHSFRNGAFNVSLANQPFDRDQSPGGRRDVPLDQVEDWQVMYPDGRVKGNFSVLALFRHFEGRGKLSRRMRRQRELFLDATSPDRV